MQYQSNEKTRWPIPMETEIIDLSSPVPEERLYEG